MKEKVVSAMETSRAWAIHEGDGDFHRHHFTSFPALYSTKKDALEEMQDLQKDYPEKNYEVKRVFVDVSF